MHPNKIIDAFSPPNHTFPDGFNASHRSIPEATPPSIKSSLLGGSAGAGAGTGFLTSGRALCNPIVVALFGGGGNSSRMGFGASLNDVLWTFAWYTPAPSDW